MFSGATHPPACEGMTRSSSVEKGERKRHSISRERNAGTTGIDLSPAFVFGVFIVPSGSAERRTVIVAPSRASLVQQSSVKLAFLCPISRATVVIGTPASTMFEP